MAGQVINATLSRIRVAKVPLYENEAGDLLMGRTPEYRPARWETEWQLDCNGNPVEIGLPQTNDDVFYNTMVYNLIRRKMRSGEFEGDLVVNLRN